MAFGIDLPNQIVKSVIVVFIQSLVNAYPAIELFKVESL